MTSYLIDTNVISAFRASIVKPRSRWFTETSQMSMYLSTLTLAEIYQGLFNPKLSPTKRTELQEWIEKRLMPGFFGRIIGFDENCAVRWGEINTVTQRTLPIIDSLIAATALAHGLTIVTRNAKDFDGIKNLSVINPWDL